MVFQEKFPTNAGGVGLTYGQNGRLAAVDSDGDAQDDFTYGYDHRNLRVVKSDAWSTTRYTYDTAGRLLEEDGPTGSVEYLYVGGVPVAVMTGLGNPIAGDSWTTIAGVDHIGTPMRLFDRSSGTVMWAADYEAFGKAYTYVPGSTQPPSVEINLRFPGQYYDAETGLHYNWCATMTRTRVGISSRIRRFRLVSVRFPRRQIRRFCRLPTWSSWSRPRIAALLLRVQ